MGVYIKGMKMPNSCYDCRFFVDAWCYAFGIDDWRNAYNKPPKGERLDNCPLVEVPPHGELIELETAKKTVRRALEVNCKRLMNTTVPMLIDFALGNAPIVIEEEDGE